MSAVTYLHTTPAHSPVGAASTRARQEGARPRLRLVPTGADVPVARGRFVLTTRGRIVLGLAVLVVAIGALSLGSRAFAATPGPVTTVTVQPGQTLSDVAHAALPSWPVDTAVAQVQLLNDLNSLQVSAGQTLRVPR